jgi:hypothetical protein
MSITIEITTTTLTLFCITFIMWCYIHIHHLTPMPCPPRAEPAQEPPIVIKEEPVEDDIVEITIPISDPDHPFFDPNSIPGELVYPKHRYHLVFDRTPDNLLNPEKSILVNAFLQVLQYPNHYDKSRLASDETYQDIRVLRAGDVTEIDGLAWEFDEEDIENIRRTYRECWSDWNRTLQGWWYNDEVPAQMEHAQERGVGVTMGQVNRWRSSRNE